jgi:hypothetical protein
MQVVKTEKAASQPPRLSKQRFEDMSVQVKNGCCACILLASPKLIPFITRLVETRRTSAFLTVITVPYRNTPYNMVQVRSV